MQLSVDWVTAFWFGLEVLVVVYKIRQLSVVVDCLTGRADALGER